MHDVYPLLEKTNFPRIFREKLHTIQINLGYKCNQACIHCHVNAGPKRKEMMDIKTIDEIVEFIKMSNIKNIDLTGGAPELNENFEYLIRKARDLGCHIIDRCNLDTVRDGRGGIFTWIPDEPIVEFNMLYFQPGKTRG